MNRNQTISQQGKKVVRGRHQELYTSLCFADDGASLEALLTIYFTEMNQQVIINGSEDINGTNPGIC